MPVYPPIFAPPNKSGHYPHMAIHDAVIWERFLDQFGQTLTSVAYDIAVGGYVVQPKEADEATIKAYQYATAMKIDAVATTEENVLVIEVKPHAGASSLGQALCYAEMLEIDGATPLPIVPCVVTDYCNPDVKYCAEQLGVILFEVGGFLTEPAPAGA